MNTTNELMDRLQDLHKRYESARTVIGMTRQDQVALGKSYAAAKRALYDEWMAGS